MMSNVIVVYVWVFLLGTCFGSFILCYAHRYIHKGSLFDRSECDKCHHRLEWYDLIPVLSYLNLKGRCRYCGKKLSLIYLVVELLGGAVPVFICALYGFSDYSLKIITFIFGTFVIIITDFKVNEIPDGCVLIFLSTELLSCDGIIERMFNGVLISLYIYFLSICMKRILNRNVIGMGDIKLFFIAGVYLGLYRSVVSILASSFTALLYGVLFRKDIVPFGPFICFGILILMFNK